MIAEIRKIKGFKLPQVNNDVIPSRWLFIDTETLERTHRGKTMHVFNIGWTCYLDRERRGKHGGYVWRFWKKAVEMNQYIEWIAEHRKGTYFVGHNIFFDLQASGFFRYFSMMGWQISWMYDKGITYIMRIRKGSSCLNIVSSTNWFNFSLEKLGGMVGLAKIDIDFQTATPHQLKVYCRRDVEILVKSIDYLIAFVKRHKLGRLGFTRGSQAYNAFRFRFMKHRIVVHREETVRELERNAYFGGRTEAFFLGNVPDPPFVSLDVNSMYPFVMNKYNYPVELVEYGNTRTIENIREILCKYGVIAEVDIDIPLPVFPVYHNKRTVFPVGRFTTFLCSEGLKYAIDRGYVKKMHRYSIYMMQNIFEDWVIYFYDLKVKYGEQDNLPMLMLVKAMLNSLYGKFGQKKITTDVYDCKQDEAYSREEVINIDNGEQTIITRIMNTELVQYPEGEAPFSIPAIPAHVTENARMYLWEIMNQAGCKNVLYCDTDSIKIREKHINGVKELLHPDRLGYLKVENRSNKLFIGGAKNYRTETRRHIKGIPLNAVEIEPGIFEYTSFTRQNTALRKRQITGVEVLEMQRKLISEYKKGEVQPDGTVKPFSF